MNAAKKIGIVVGFSVIGMGLSATDAAEITFGSAGQFVVDTAYNVSAVSVIKSVDPASLSVGTFGHGRTGFESVPNIGTLAGGSSGTALYIGNGYSDTTSNYTSFDHSIVKLTFANPIVNRPGNDLALMQGVSKSISAVQGFQNETVAIGIDSSVESPSSYDNKFWYQAVSDYKPTTNIGASNEYGYGTSTYDLSNLGVPLGGSVGSIYVSNFDVFSTVSNVDGQSGWVDFDGSAGYRIEGGPDRDPNFYTASNPLWTGAVFTGSVPTKPAGSNSFYLLHPTLGVYFDNDPDLIFAGGIVPEPASLGLLGVAGMLIGRRRRV